ncbi:unnamed protein product [Rotaria sp. Silwood2]|nr:unnamed protein product [Rotaria sp. Silwood2]CAF3154762.1 unnamed protein product [Rotaria sp. Silwood2]CAF3964521.1 unnamed protein product [Rotaria sp. Silwood2]CAF4009120.1 unnamed protein product [Rotaria sp. Silwood2]
MASSWIDLSNLQKPLKFNEFQVNFNTELYDAKPLPSDIQKKLDNIWNYLLNHTKPEKVLFNESKFRLHSIETKTNNENNSIQLILNLGLTDYKSFICTQQQDLPQEIRQYITEDHLAHPLGVACILITSDNYIVLIKRSSACADLPNTYDLPGGHAEPKNLNTYTNENIIKEIISSVIAECVNETNVDRNSLLIDSDFYIVIVMRSQKHYGRPVFEFCLRTTMTSNELQQRYNLQTQNEAYETSELKCWPIDKILDLLSPSNTSVPINPACHAALTAYIRLFC